jgi:RNA polymerase sigma factor (sigma-70 family)
MKKADIENTFVKDTSLDTLLASDTELLTWIAQKDRYPEEAESAFTEFYERFSDYLNLAVSKIASKYRMFGSDFQDAVFNNTFMRVYDRASTFKDGGIRDAKRLNLRIKAWLGKIAQNELLQLLREEKKQKEKTSSVLEVYGAKNNDWEDDFDKEEVSEEIPLNVNQQLLARALATLKERDRDILLTYYDFFQPDNPTLKLPRKEIQKLSGLYDTTPAHLRKIKQRALEKVIKFIQEYS